MWNLPTDIAFKNGSKIYDDYMELYDTTLLPMINEFLINFPAVDIPLFLRKFEEKRLNIFEKIILDYNKTDNAKEWLINQPPFISSISDLNYQYQNRTKVLIRNIYPKLYRLFFSYTLQMPDDIKEIRLKIKNLELLPENKENEKQLNNLLNIDYKKSNQFITDFLRKNIEEFKLEKPELIDLINLQEKFKEHNLKLELHKSIYDIPREGIIKYSAGRWFFIGANNFYIASIAEISRMAFWYLTNTYLEKITESKAHIENIIEALQKIHNEVDILTTSNWYPKNIRQLTLPRIDLSHKSEYQKRSIHILKNILNKETQLIKRIDKTAQERLMIIDIIRTYKTLFGFNISKREIYRLMELPFINNLIDMKTIERIIKSETSIEK